MHLSLQTYRSAVPLFLIHEVVVVPAPSATGSGSWDIPVMGKGDVAGLDLAEILHERLVMATDLLGGLAAANGPSEVVPPVGGVPVVKGERVLEQLVLPCGPHAGATARARTRSHAQ